VNLSARQVQHPDLAQDVTLVLQGTELETSRLNLAIKEGAVMEDASPPSARFEN
jgi:EAL domain-containing protein (putative c-di-GMP-specific phosphodiesterase class I)